MRRRTTMEVIVNAVSYEGPTQIAGDTIHALQHIDRVCFNRGERTDIKAEITRPFTRVWAARIPALDRAWIGYIITWHVADELHILNVAADPSHRRRGIGRALVQRAVQYAQNNQIRLMLLEVRRSNQPAISLYNSFGFSVINMRQGYYSDNGEDALEMVLVLDPETGDIVHSRDEMRSEEV